jgi:hypothetical protein
MAAVDIIIDEDPGRPTIVELAPILDDITEDPIKVRWENSKPELLVLASHPNKRFLLCVLGMHEMERAVGLLGRKIKIDDAALRTGIKALASAPQQQLPDWRSYLDQAKSLTPRHVILKLAADSLRVGEATLLTTGLVDDLIFGGIDPRDMDVMFRIRSNRFKRNHGK